jgi:hypothetical protein
MGSTEPAGVGLGITAVVSDELILTDAFR